MFLDVKIIWTEKLKKHFSINKAKKWIHKWIVKILAFLEAKSVPATPIRTGHLRKWYDSIAKWFWGKLYNDTEYAIFVHNWTKYIWRNPFLKRVVKNHWNKTGKIMKKEIFKTLNFL